MTISEPGTSEVLYGKEEHNYEHSTQGKTTNYTFYDYKSGYIHHCLVDGLEVMTHYIHCSYNESMSYFVFVKEGSSFYCFFSYLFFQCWLVLLLKCVSKWNFHWFSISIVIIILNLPCLVIFKNIKLTFMHYSLV